MDSLHSAYTKLSRSSVGDILQDGPRYVQKQLLLRIQGVYYRRKLHATTSQIAERRRAALDKLERGSTILFLCHGNICRSPFAEQYTRQQVETRNITGISVESSGLLDQPERRSPPKACIAADRRGVNLDNNSSTQANTELIKQSDLIILMDYGNYHNFTTQFSDAADRMFLLGIFNDHEEIPISDPYNNTLETFGTSYDRIISNVDGLLDAFEAQLKTGTTTIGKD